MSNVRSNWGPPVRYLEKRGYMDNHHQQHTFANNAVDPSPKEQDDSLNNSDYLDDPYFGEKFIQRMKEKWNSLWRNGTTSAPLRQNTNINIKASTVSLPNNITSNSKSQMELFGGESDQNLSDDGSENNAIQLTSNVNNTNSTIDINDQDVEYLRKLINCSSYNKTNIATNIVNNTKKGAIIEIYFFFVI